MAQKSVETAVNFMRSQLQSWEKQLNAIDAKMQAPHAALDSAEVAQRFAGELQAKLRQARNNEDQASQASPAPQKTQQEPQKTYEEILAEGLQGFQEFYNNLIDDELIKLSKERTEKKAFVDSFKTTLAACSDWNPLQISSELKQRTQDRMKQEAGCKSKEV